MISETNLDQSHANDNQSPRSHTDQLIAAYMKLGIGLMLIVMVGVGFLVITMALDAPAENRTRTLREATCARNGMILLQDKYHPAVCAFRVDEDGNRIKE